MDSYRVNVTYKPHGTSDSIIVDKCDSELRAMLTVTAYMPFARFKTIRAVKMNADEIDNNVQHFEALEGEL